ncbi:proteasome ATPase [uncultured Ilumatobacter sp.]|jgi:proteasome-associated ATPase|uniref:proteasome ATPase n=1 Tax=Ilumatobacter sp. TaxID=1967498 RepID=UPI0030AD210C|tara:strand:- start:1722 stop:3431 length:1710 start_codon:yes stop_codon:yes gene_type:complete
MASPDESTADLDAQVASLREEIEHLRGRLSEAPRRTRSLEERLLETKGQLAQAVGQNEKLSYTLREAREQITTLRDEVDKLSQPPSAYGVVVGKNDDQTVDVLTSGRKMRVSLHPDIDHELLNRGAEVVLNESFNVVMSRASEITGEVVTVKNVMEDGIRALVVGRADEERVCELADNLRGTLIRSGDHLRLDVRSNLLLEKLPRPEVEDLLLEEVPDISYTDIGGLDEQIEQIADAVELPFLHHDLFAEHQLPAPKGILLYGPPGCGKTLIAKAVANSLAKKVAEKVGEGKGRSYFINIKGPELLNKYVGETERQIRLVFQRAREKSDEGWPVIVFFDEMDSMFRTRGTGISSDMESTIVPQLLAEIDGVEGLKNVIVIGATNREDLIDPAILRPGRLDVKIKIERPNEIGARAIFAQYLTNEIPLDQSESIDSMLDATVSEMYKEDEANKFLEVTYQNGDKEIMYYKDFSSGAMIENIVRRAKKLAIKRVINGGEKGVRTQDLLDSIKQEYKEHQDLPNTTNPDDWAKISGKKGERIIFIRTLVTEDTTDDPTGGRAIERAQTGQYL